MKIEEYFIRDMICSRCIKVLEEGLSAIGVEVKDIRLGRIQIIYNSKEIKFSEIEKVLQENEFEILKDEESILAEQTKKWIVKFIWNTDQTENLSTFLNKQMNKSYQILSRNFSMIFEQNIENYYIQLKIERVKELVEYNEMSFGEIAYSLGYQNLSALSRQFKRETGITMKAYKELKLSKRIPLDII
jgi:YesN/AraC family two-component response regulator